jgi:hypothetical protein
MVFSTGELVQAIPNVTTGVAAPMYLTQDGAVNWMPVAVFNPVAGSTATMTVKDTWAPVAEALRCRLCSARSQPAGALCANA